MGFYFIISHLKLTGPDIWAGICGVSPGHGKSLVIFAFCRSQFWGLDPPQRDKGDSGAVLRAGREWEFQENPGLTGIRWKRIPQLLPELNSIVLKGSLRGFLCGEKTPQYFREGRAHPQLAGLPPGHGKCGGHGISLLWQGEFQPWIHLEPGFFFSPHNSFLCPWCCPTLPDPCREEKPHCATSQGHFEDQLPLRCSSSVGPDLAGASESAALKNNPKTALIPSIYAKIN